MLLKFHQGTRYPATGEPPTERRNSPLSVPGEERSPEKGPKLQGLDPKETCPKLPRLESNLESRPGRNRGYQRLDWYTPQETYRKRLELKPTRTSIWEEKKAIQRRIFLCWLENNLPAHKLKKRFLGRELFPRMCSMD